MKNLATSILFVLFVTYPSFGSVSGILEDFFGVGEHGGFHDPDWIVTSDGEFQNGTYVIENINGDSNIDQSDFLERIIDGKGSFRSILELRALRMRGGEHTVSGLTFSHRLSSPNNGGVGIFLDNERPDDQWSFWDTHAFTLPKPVPIESPLRLIIEFDVTSSLYTVAYDNDPRDDIAPIRHDESMYRPDVSEFQEFFLRVVAGGRRASVYAELDYLSILPLDAAPGDFSGDGVLDLDDLEMMTRATRIGRVDSLFDLDGDTHVDANDIAYWVRELGNSYIGDANLDGEFNSSDLVLVFNAGEYEDDVSGASIWYSGDWNGDGDFTTADLVFAFQDAGYEMGPRSEIQFVPEPTFIHVSLLFVVGLFGNYRRRKSDPSLRCRSFGWH
ncbi:MAG: hypothetical protein KDA87_12765 [Planctomycetales bacterium]|nr:hypothetical protein [Planctomycetales bacterium]